MCGYRESHASRSKSECESEANRIISRFIVDGTDEEVNLPGSIKEQLLGTDPGYSLRGGTPFKGVAAGTATAELFFDAEKEIFNLMDRDAFARFKKDPNAVRATRNAAPPAAGRAGRRSRWLEAASSRCACPGLLRYVLTPVSTPGRVALHTRQCCRSAV